LVLIGLLAITLGYAALAKKEIVLKPRSETESYLLFIAGTFLILYPIAKSILKRTKGGN
jgi:hypothetical protein